MSLESYIAFSYLCCSSGLQKKKKKNYILLIVHIPGEALKNPAILHPSAS